MEHTFSITFNQEKVVKGFAFIILLTYNDYKIKLSFFFKFNLKIHILLL